jgi:hypothetical protein
VVDVEGQGDFAERALLASTTAVAASASVGFARTEAAVRTARFSGGNTVGAAPTSVEAGAGAKRESIFGLLITLSDRSFVGRRSPKHAQHHRCWSASTLGHRRVLEPLD